MWATCNDKVPSWPCNVKMPGACVWSVGNDDCFPLAFLCWRWMTIPMAENSGTPKSSILIGFSILNHPFWGTSIFGNTHVDIQSYPDFWLPSRVKVWPSDRVLRGVFVWPMTDDPWKKHRMIYNQTYQTQKKIAKREVVSNPTLIWDWLFRDMVIFCWEGVGLQIQWELVNYLFNTIPMKKLAFPLRRWRIVERLRDEERDQMIGNQHLATIFT